MNSPPDCDKTIQLKGTTGDEEFLVDIDLCYMASQDDPPTATIASVTVTFVNPQPSPSSPPQEPILLSLKGTPKPFKYDTTEGGIVEGRLNIVRFGGDPATNAGVWTIVDYPEELESVSDMDMYVHHPEDQEQPVTPTRHFEGILLGSTFFWKVPV